MRQMSGPVLGGDLRRGVGLCVSTAALIPVSSVVFHLRVNNRRDPLTRLASADENASSSHPLPQGGEGSKINSPLAPLGERGSGVRGSVHYPIVKHYAGHHTRSRLSAPCPLSPMTYTLLLITRHSSLVTSYVTSACQEAT
jgi:hypothetical protein